MCCRPFFLGEGRHLSSIILPIQFVGNQAFPSTTKKSNTQYVHEPHFFNAYDSMRNDKEPRAIELALYTSGKKGKKMTV